MAKLVQFEYQNKKYTLDYNPLNKIRIYQFILNICKYINEREAQWEGSMVEKNGRVWRYSGYLNKLLKIT